MLKSLIVSINLMNCERGKPIWTDERPLQNAKRGKDFTKETSRKNH